MNKYNPVIILVFCISLFACKHPTQKKEFYPSGKLKSECTMVNGMKNGTMKAYDEDGHVTDEGHFINDTIEGEAKSFYPSGKVKQISYWKKGVLQGDFKSYFEDGPVEISGSYHNGELNGPYLSYYHNG